MVHSNILLPKAHFKIEINGKCNEKPFSEIEIVLKGWGGGSFEKFGLQSLVFILIFEYFSNFLKIRINKLIITCFFY